MDAVEKLMGAIEKLAASSDNLPRTKELQEYAAYCPSCGNLLTFQKAYRVDQIEAVQGKCSFGHCWSMVFDLDKSGTFGVMSFQCDNEDRIQDD